VLGKEWLWDSGLESRDIIIGGCWNNDRGKRAVDRVKRDDWPNPFPGACGGIVLFGVIGNRFEDL